MRQLLAAAPVIAAVRREEDLPRALQSPVRAVFLLCGDINNLAPMVSRLRSGGKEVFLHLDLVQGFGHDRPALRFIAQQVRPSGILTTKSHLIRLGKDEGLSCIQRVFVLDQQSLSTAVAQSKQAGPTAVEVMPGILPNWALEKLVAQIPVPVIAGGLVRTAEDVSRILSCGVAGVSIGSADLWPFIPNL